VEVQKCGGVEEFYIEKCIILSVIYPDMTTLKSYYSRGPVTAFALKALIIAQVWYIW